MKTTDESWVPGSADEIMNAPGGDRIIREAPRKLIAWLQSQDEIRDVKRVGAGLYTFNLLTETGPLPCSMTLEAQGPVGVGPEVDQRKLRGRD